MNPSLSQTRIWTSPYVFWTHPLEEFSLGRTEYENYEILGTSGIFMKEHLKLALDFQKSLLGKQTSRTIFLLYEVWLFCFLMEQIEVSEGLLCQDLNVWAAELFEIVFEIKLREGNFFWFPVIWVPGFPYHFVNAFQLKSTISMPGTGYG